MARVSSEQILRGPLVRTMVRLGWPAMVTSLLQALYNLADAFWIGHLPPATSGPSVAAIQISWPVVWLLISFVAGLNGSAASALISQYTGAERHEEANHATTQILAFLIISGVVIAVAGYLVAPHLLDLLVDADAVTREASLYIRTIFIGMPLLGVPFLFQFSMAAYGDTVTPMFVNSTGVVLNILLDPILIFGFGPIPSLGLFGAAIGTVISQGLAALIALSLLYRGQKGLRIVPSHVRPQWAWFRKITSIGLPAAIGQSGTAFGFVVLMAIIGRVPNATVALAAYGIGDRMIGILFIAISGLAVGLTTILGQSLGADLPERAWAAVRQGTAFMFGLLAVEALVIWLAREPLMTVFIPGRTDIIAAGVEFLGIFAPAMPFFGLFAAVGAVFRGSGHNVPTMIMEIARLWAFRVPLCAVFALVLGMGATGVWYGMMASNIAAAGLAVALFATGTWQRKVI